MKDLRAEAEGWLRDAERTVAIQKQRLAVMDDPVVALACQLHGLLCREWCAGEGVCFEPYREEPRVLDGWAISADEVRSRYMNAAGRIHAATRDLNLTAEQTKAVVQAVLDAKLAGDAEKFRR